MHGIKIEKNVPLPDGSLVYKKYDWSKLEIGDSFVIDGANTRMAVRSSFIQFQKTHPDFFPPKTVLVSRDIGDGHYRFWLLKNP